MGSLWAGRLGGSTNITKGRRRGKWQGIDFAGTIDWAVDLQRLTDDEWGGIEGVEDDDLSWDETLADCTGNYDTLGSILGDTPSHCRNVYILQSLRRMLNDSVEQYDKLSEGGYDRKFGTYASAVAESDQKQIDNFMFTKGNDYFKCKVWERYTRWAWPSPRWATPSTTCRRSTISSTGGTPRSARSSCWPSSPPSSSSCPSSARSSA